MGITTSSENSNLPKGSSVLQKDSKTLKHIIEIFITQGYAAIDISELFEKDSKNQDQFDKLFSSASSFFNQTEEKTRLSDDKRAFENIGYLKIGDIREYIKLRTGDAESVWPKEPKDFRADFIRVFDDIKNIAWILFEAAVREVEITEATKYFPDAKEQYEDLKSFVFEKSTMSLIHYFEQSGNSNSDGKINVCDSHKDTGFITCAVSCPTPGLEIWDKKQGKFVPVEEKYPSKTLVCFLGEKLALYSKKYEATPHRVLVKERTERLSMIFLLDSTK